MSGEKKLLTCDLSMHFGHREDGVIGLPCRTHDGHVVEASYFFGEQKPKNIIVVSTQVSCPLRCTFCELGKVAFVRNLTSAEIVEQVEMITREARRSGHALTAMPHKITFANSGEPLLNAELVPTINCLASLGTSFKVSTVLPQGRVIRERICALARFASTLARPVQLQISLISTSERQRTAIAGAAAASFAEIYEAAYAWRTYNPLGRKVNLSIMLTESMECRPDVMRDLFPPELFRFRFREYVPTKNGAEHLHIPISNERLREVKNRFGECGYEVFDDASPTPTEKRFGLASNSIRRIYLDLTTKAHP